jgi:uncharacterized protein YggU (UPF0235/DUF167 family)
VTDAAEPPSQVVAHPRGSVFAVTVVPRGGRNAIERGSDGALRVRVTAPPVAGAANTAVLRLLADALGVRRADLEILSGGSARRKRILVSGLDSEELERRIRVALSQR